MKKKQYTPVIWIGKKRYEYKQTYPTKKEALIVSERKVKEIIKLNKSTKKKIFGNVKSITSGYNEY